MEHDIIGDGSGRITVIEKGTKFSVMDAYGREIYEGKENLHKWAFDHGKMPSDIYGMTEKEFKELEKGK